MTIVNKALGALLKQEKKSEDAKKVYKWLLMWSTHSEVFPLNPDVVANEVLKIYKRGGTVENGFIQKMVDLKQKVLEYLTKMISIAHYERDRASALEASVLLEIVNSNGFISMKGDKHKFIRDHLDLRCVDQEYFYGPLVDCFEGTLIRATEVERAFRQIVTVMN